MSNLQLRRAAREIFDQALAAVDAGDAVRRSVIPDGSTLRIAATEIDLAADKPIYAIAIGKAAYPMAAALDKLLGARLIAGVIAGSPRSFLISSRRSRKTLKAKIRNLTCGRSPTHWSKD